MTYRLDKIPKTPYAVHLIVGSAAALSSGDAIPYVVDAGTSGHGVTVTNGVIVLPKGDWLVSFTAEADTSTIFQGNIYVDSTIDTTFPAIQSLASTANSNLDSTVIPIESHGSTTVEIRVNASVTVSGSSDCLIYGFKI